MKISEVHDQAPHLIIMGIRGLPAAHGGFETFAQRLALHLLTEGWRVTVYCQGSPTGKRMVDTWEGITRIHIPVTGDTSWSSIAFDIKATIDVGKVPGTLLTLGYNTGFLCTLLAMQGRINYINMDGLEWKRAKYGLGPKAYLWLNERLAIWSATRLIADHPSIADHLATRTTRERIVTIPYGADPIESADVGQLARFGLEPGRFMTVIARAEPENSILEIVRGFSMRPRGIKLVVLGKYSDTHAFQRQVRAEAGPEVIFPGAIYDSDQVRALRFFARAYIHGHQVGGTNPSLVEALAAGNAVIAHDNPFNRWVAGDAGLWFDGPKAIDAHLASLDADPQLLSRLSQAAHKRWLEHFTWAAILSQYQTCLGG